MGSGSSSSAIDAVAPGDAIEVRDEHHRSAPPSLKFLLTPFHDRVTTKIFEAHVVAAPGVLQTLCAKVATSDTDGGAADSETWQRIARLLMIMGIDRTVLPAGDLSSEPSDESSSDEDMPTNDDDQLKKSVAKIRCSLEGRRAEYKRMKQAEKRNALASTSNAKASSSFSETRRSQQAAAESPPSKFRGTVIQLLDCARISVLRSQGQDGGAWECLGSALWFLERRRQVLSSRNTTQEVITSGAIRCNIYDETVGASECFSKAWMERGVESAEVSLVHLDALRLLSASLEVEGNAAQNFFLLRSKAQLQEVLTKIIMQLERKRNQAALWFVLSRILSILSDPLSTRPQPLTVPAPSVSDALGTRPLHADLRYGHLDGSVEHVCWYDALSNAVECDPRDFVLWYRLISHQWPEIVSSSAAASRPDCIQCGVFASHLVVEQLPSLSIGIDRALPMEKAVARALQHHHRHAHVDALEFLEFSRTRGFVDPKHVELMYHSLLAALVAIVERAVHFSGAALETTIVSYRGLLLISIGISDDTDSPSPDGGGDIAKAVETTFHRCVAFNRDRNEMSSCHAQQLLKMATMCEHVDLWCSAPNAHNNEICAEAEAEGEGDQTDHSHNDRAIVLELLTRFPDRAVMWRYLAVLLSRRDAVRYVAYWHRVAKSIQSGGGFRRPMDDNDGKHLLIPVRRNVPRVCRQAAVEPHTAVEHLHQNSAPPPESLARNSDVGALHHHHHDGRPTAALLLESVRCDRQCRRQCSC